MDVAKKVLPIMIIRGVISILFGLLVVYNPLLSLTLLMIFFGAYVLVAGLFGLYYAVTHKKSDPHWRLQFMEGLLGFVIGLIVLLSSSISAVMLLYIVAFWAILSGVMQLSIAMRWRTVRHYFWLAISGIITLLFAMLLMLYPADGILALAWLIGLYAILSGLVLLVLGLRLR